MIGTLILAFAVGAAGNLLASRLETVRETRQERLRRAARAPSTMTRAGLEEPLGSHGQDSDSAAIQPDSPWPRGVKHPYHATGISGDYTSDTPWPR